MIHAGKLEPSACRSNEFMPFPNRKAVGRSSNEIRLSPFLCQPSARTHRQRNGDKGIQAASPSQAVVPILLTSGRRRLKGRFALRNGISSLPARRKSYSTIRQNGT